MLKNILVTLSLIMSALPAHSVVRFNNYTGFWEGNVCANYHAWTYVPFQPIGSFCQFSLPNGQVMQGIIINQ